MRSMPSGVVVHASDHQAETVPAKEVPSLSRPANAELFSGPDPSMYMLGLPKSHPKLGRWVAVAIIAGGIAAFVLVAFFVH
ncbi:MAG: hypothetical protein WA211_12155 [Candidatus Acidiferrales bacterium]